MADSSALVTLKNGETMQVLRLEAPCGHWARPIVDFMYLRHIEYANCSWHQNCKRVVNGDFADVSRDVFFLGLIDNEIVGSCWYATPRDTGDLATFGRVVTAVPQRRKGISSELCRAAVEDFRRTGGWCMHLGTGRQNPARFIYESLGFQHYNYIEDDGTIMRAVLQGDYAGFESEYFAPDQPVRLRPLHWGDFARVELLHNLPHWFLKSYTGGIYANTPYEGQFFDLMNAVEAGETGLGLETTEQRLVGFATTARTGAGTDAQDHVRVLDFVVHPGYAENAPQLVAAAAMESAVPRLLSYASALDLQKIEALEEAGFIQEATLEGVLQDAESEFDLYVYSMEK